ncbi:unnamed protein product [Pseudo-nitzschia multistriata]|uniref:Uncharacterized protein n=1 Tax=Pseudo-nitzschia multistriata TaxID=183589 RepID=A0A448Z3C2_9STRA|nr:unnamed protein product [Pseudo-nitzschia multistriata]
MYWWAVSAAFAVVVVALVRYWHLDSFVLGLLSLLDLLLAIKRRARSVQTKSPEWTMADTIEESCSKHWDNLLMVMAGQNDDSQCPSVSSPSQNQKPKAQMTYGEAEMASSAVARWITATTASKAALCEPDDAVAIFMPSSCEFVAALFGLIRSGVRAALVNTELRGTSLVHALTSALDRGSDAGAAGARGVRAVLVSPGLKHVFDSLREAGQLPSSIAVIECGAGCELDPWTETRRFAFHGRQAQPKSKASGWDGTCLYIYTSGTTGFPKASKMNHMRIWMMGCAGKKLCRLRSGDRLYCPLPLHHSSGLGLGLGACLQSGCTTVVRPKFSVRQFSRDIATHRCTGVQYIGEMARYLVSAPPSPFDSDVRLRFALGNGMPQEIWLPFQKRYNIDLVNEFYASTEGNVNVFNGTGVAPGACGIVPLGFGWIYPIGIFRYDTDTGELLRDATTGLCVPASPNEPGELLGLIKSSDPTRRFDGYTNHSATRSKIVSNVCRKGDRYFRSGDLLRQDRRGFLYFCDRVGETFRWKGENVSTSEVARALLECRGNGVGSNTQAAGATEAKGDTAWFAEAVVYGVEVEGYPGRAGMATVVMNEGASSNKWQDSLWRSLQAELPRYAQPLFLRIATEIEKTSTQKYKKKKLQDESFFDCGGDAVYFRDDAANRFVPMDETIHHGILSGNRRV